MVTEEQIRKFLEAYPELSIDALYRMVAGDQRDRMRGALPRRQMGLEKLRVRSQG